jgi:hypothetical protein
MATNDTEYYRGRAISERALAMAAQNPLVGAIHEELARQYQALADHVELRPDAETSDYQVRRSTDESRWHRDWKSAD